MLIAPAPTVFKAKRAQQRRKLLELLGRGLTNEREAANHPLQFVIKLEVSSGATELRTCAARRPASRPREISRLPADRRVWPTRTLLWCAADCRWRRALREREFPCQWECCISSPDLCFCHCVRCPRGRRGNSCRPAAECQAGESDSPEQSSRSTSLRRRPA